MTIPGGALCLGVTPQPGYYISSPLWGRVDERKRQVPRRSFRLEKPDKAGASAPVIIPGGVHGRV